MPGEGGLYGMWMLPVTVDRQAMTGLKCTRGALRVKLNANESRDTQAKRRRPTA